uniref:Uncharacterized protein n=1 Tax=Arundo donax TaxID=35708 RepID=A0A0A8Z890_ARUDO
MLLSLSNVSFSISPLSLLIFCILSTFSHFLNSRVTALKRHLFWSGGSI